MRSVAAERASFGSCWLPGTAAPRPKIGQVSDSIKQPKTIPGSCAGRTQKMMSSWSCTKRVITPSPPFGSQRLEFRGGGRDLRQNLIVFALGNALGRYVSDYRLFIQSKQPVRFSRVGLYDWVLLKNCQPEPVPFLPPANPHDSSPMGTPPGNSERRHSRDRPWFLAPESAPAPTCFFHRRATLLSLWRQSAPGPVRRAATAPPRRGSWHRRRGSPR